MSIAEITTTADWLAANAVVVGTLRVSREGLSFRSVIPNPARAVDLPAERIEKVTRSGEHGVEVVLRSGEGFSFVAENADAVRLALEQLIALNATGAYR